VDERKRSVLEEGEVLALVDVKRAVSRRIETARLRDHRRRDVDAVNEFEMRCEGLGHAADATPEIEGAARSDSNAERCDVLERRADLLTPGHEELVSVPAIASLCRVVQHRP
jgi:hypothetical protein